jgi:hypothetical protein
VSSSLLQVNLVNATNIDALSKRHLKQHPRVTAPGGKLITKERDDPLAVLFGDIVGCDQDEDETDDDDNDNDDDDDDDGFGGGVGFGFMGGLAGMMDGGGGANAGFAPMMNPMMQMMMSGGGHIGDAGGALHHALAQMLLQQGLMEEGEEDPFGSGDGEDEDEDDSKGEWETDSEERGYEPRGEYVTQREEETAEAESDSGDGEDADDESGEVDGDSHDEDEEEYTPGEMLAAMMMAGMPPHLAAARVMAAMEGGDGGSEGESDGDGHPRAGSPQCVIEEVD